MENATRCGVQNKLLEKFVDKLRRVYAGGLVSVILYGSAASGEFADKHSNINILIVLADTGLANIAKSSTLFSLGRFKQITPVFFTEEYIRTSTDVFPIEFLDMKENYRVLYGKDLLKDLPIDTRNLRFQCEQELKSKLINIKSRYLMTRNRPELERLLFRSLTSTVHIFRNILRLKGREAPYRKAEILSRVERELSVDTTVLNEILYAKTKNMKLTYSDIDGLLSGLVKELEAIIKIVDTM